MIAHNCEKRFTSKESLRNHLKKIHQIEQSAVCNTCGRIFKNHQELRIHWKSEGKNKISEKMSFDESVIFFSNLAYMAHIRQSPNLFMYISQKKAETINKVTSTEVPCIRPNVSTTFSRLKMNNFIFCAVEVGFYHHL